jgi:hypothetical protein
MKIIEYLYVLIGREILEIHQEISTTVPIDGANENKILTEVPLVLFFDGYRFFIFNNWSNTGNSSNFEEIIGKKISKIDMENQFLILKLDTSSSVRVDRSDDGFNGPESLVLQGPNNSFAIWN